MQLRFPAMVAMLILIAEPSTGQSSANSANSLKDVFPLRPALCYSYEFSDSSELTDYTLSWIATNKGTLRYHIVDSSITGDTAVVWNVLEIRAYQARRIRYEIVGPPTDSTFDVSDTASLQLTESLAGNHELRCDGIVWSFPLGHLNNVMHEPIFRYADSPSTRLTWSWMNPPGYAFYGRGTDTLEASTTAGYLRRSLVEDWWSGYYVGFNSSQVRAASLPSAVQLTSDLVPNTSRLYQNFPNPFNPSTTIRFRLDRSSGVSLQIINLLGQAVETLYEGGLQPGEYSVLWNARNHPSGVYLCRLRSSQRSYEIKLLLVR
jgi:hypothetical protein